MKKFIFKSRSGHLFLPLLLAGAMIFTATIGAFAISDGQHVNLSYNSTSYEYDGMSYAIAEFYIPGNDKYIGTCAQYGRDDFPGGVTLQRADNNSLAAKAIYYFGVVRGWQDYLGRDHDRGGAFQAIAHYVSGSLDPYLINEDEHPNMYRQAHAEKARADASMALYPEWRNVNVPEGFEFYYGKADNPNAQNVYFWIKNPTGKIALKKASAIPGITG